MKKKNIESFEDFFLLNGKICKIYNRFEYGVYVSNFDNSNNIFIKASLSRKTKRYFKKINLYDIVVLKLLVFNPKQNVKIIKWEENK